MDKGLLAVTTVPFDVGVVWVLLKWVFWLVAVMFVMFGVIMMTQVKQMTAAFKRPFNTVITFISLVYFGLTILVLLLALGAL